MYALNDVHSLLLSNCLFIMMLIAMNHCTRERQRERERGATFN